MQAAEEFCRQLKKERKKEGARREGARKRAVDSDVIDDSTDVTTTDVIDDSTDVTTTDVIDDSTDVTTTDVIDDSTDVTTTDVIDDSTDVTTNEHTGARHTRWTYPEQTPKKPTDDGFTTEDDAAWRSHLAAIADKSAGKGVEGVTPAKMKQT